MNILRGTIIAIILCVGAIGTAASQQSSQISLPAFHTIDTKGNVELVVAPSDSLSSITVELYGIKGDGFDYEVRNGVLYIDVPTGIFAPAGHIRVFAATPELNTIRIQGAKVEFLKPLRGESFTLETYGTINQAELWVDVERLSVTIGGHSDVVVRGRAQRALLNASLGSSIDAISLNVENANANAYEGSEIYLIVDNILSARASTSGTIYYEGGCTLDAEEILWGKVQKIRRAKDDYIEYDARQLEGNSDSSSTHNNDSASANNTTSLSSEQQGDSEQGETSRETNFF